MRISIRTLGSLLVALALPAACGAADAATEGDVAQGTAPAADEDTASAGEALTVFTGNPLWTPGQTIDICFLTTSLPTQQQWVKDITRSTWEYVANIKFNFLSSCPATGSLVRIGIGTRTNVNETQDGWTSGSGPGCKKDERASNNGHLGSPAAERPSIKFYFQPAITDANKRRIEYLAVHEFGHMLGFAEEASHPNFTQTCTGNLGDQTAVTGVDPNSIMNYCGFHGNNQGTITYTDILGIQSLYGANPAYTLVNQWFVTVD